ncbi:radical SAM protein [Fodinicurvata sp. EGI_FJ10296]|uniref:B12-binding domain-containing radical SAM protein n=1 Tax=Fodinicurvata sp. EGI_FJ10296 TaxID=3231908 RepID=UPI003455646D
MNDGAKHRVLVINAYFDPWRMATPTRLFVPRAMAPYFLAGHFNRQICEVRVWDEAFHGAFVDRRLFSWPDMVVFTGLTASFDRARQLAAYFRCGNPKAVTVIGGPIPRALPGICKTVFDHVCMGDAEQIAQVIQDLLGKDAVDPAGAPRFDMTGPKMGLGFVETTTNCNFACSFCSLTGESRPYLAHSDDSITRQMDAMGRVKGVMVLDNNFFGSNRKGFEHRVKLLGDRWRAGQFRGWAALVTGDFFKRPDNLKLVAENGCLGLFSGVESLDPEVLKTFNKKQSLASDPLSLAQACAEHGIQFDYGLIVDFAQQTMAEVDAQIDGLIRDHRMPMPGLLSLTIPIVGTPYFDTSISAGRMMPGVLLSDMDGQKLVEWPREPVGQVKAFLRDMLRMRGRKLALMRHVMRHAWHWRKALPAELTALSVVRPLHRFGPRIGLGSPAQMRQTWQEPRLTYSATTDARRLAYRPLIRMPDRFAADFEPLAVTDGQGRLTDAFEQARAQPDRVG